MRLGRPLPSPFPALKQAPIGLRADPARVKLVPWPLRGTVGKDFIRFARQWHPIEYLYEMVDLCRLYKVPLLHLHFTDDQGYRLPSEAYPNIPTRGASYSMREMRDFVAYADSRGVTVIPEIELPGHSSALQGAMPEVFGAKNPATGKFDTLGVLNIANEQIYPVLDSLIGEACGLFKSSPYFHMGGDEVQFAALFD